MRSLFNVEQTESLTRSWRVEIEKKTWNLFSSKREKRFFRGHNSVIFPRQEKTNEFRKFHQFQATPRAQISLN